LVIDDFALARAQLRQLLTAAGFLVFEQSSATGATRTILTHKVQAVIVDVNMPGLSGDRLVGVLRKNPRLRDLVIVIVSGKSDAELQKISRVADANAVLSKSNLGELVPTLTRYLGRAETVTSSA
jgi:two-component system chemotaxis response regulator CheV